jgi:hypothetical protein
VRVRWPSSSCMSTSRRGEKGEHYAPTILHTSPPDTRRQTERLRLRGVFEMKDRWGHLRMCLSCGRVVFYVKDLQRSLVFYRDQLGLKEVGGLQRGGCRRTDLRPDTSRAGVDPGGKSVAESFVWLYPDQEVQITGIPFANQPREEKTG